MAKWLFKTEPSTYSFDDLLRDKKTVWEGVKNPTALIHLRSMRKGDDVIVHHTGNVRSAVGFASVASNPYADPKLKNEKLVVVDLKAGKRFKNPVTLDQIKSEKIFATFDLVRIGRLSIVPVPDAMWKRIEELRDGQVEKLELNMTSPHSDIPPQTSADEESPHKPADDREEVYFHGSPLLRGEVGRVLGFMFVAIVFVAIPILYWFYKNQWPPLLVTLGCILIGAIFAVIPVVMTKTYRYRISNYRIDFERGLLSRNIDTLELWHVEDISFHQSLIDRVLHVGTITVISHDDTTPRLELKSLPNPRPLFDMLKQRIIAVKRQRGVIKMDVGT